MIARHNAIDRRAVTLSPEATLATAYDFHDRLSLERHDPSAYSRSLRYSA